MGEIHIITCDNCSFSTRTVNWILMSTGNSDYNNELYCLDCQKIVKVCQRKNGKLISSIKQKCPCCNSHNIFLELPDNVKCPKCKEGNLRSKLDSYID